MEESDILDGVDFSELDDDFYLEREFDAVKKFRTEGSFSFSRNGHSDGYIGISFRNKGETEPAKYQIDTLHYFQKNQNGILNSFCQFFLDSYPELMESYEQSEFDADIGFPELINPEQVKNLIGIEGLCIRNQEKNGLAYFGISCSCPWDIEHGLGVIMHQESVILMDRADICSFGGRTEIQKDNGTYSEEEHRKELEDLEKSRAEYISRLSAEDSKKWWQFWK